MSPLIFVAVLCAALLHAVWNAIIKVSGDRLVIMAVTVVASAFIGIPFLIILPAPAIESWPFLGMSAAIHGLYMLLLVRAYGHGDFAQIYPLSRGSAPLLTAFLGFILLNESMALTEFLGMLLIIIGIFGLALERSGGKLNLTRAALIYSLLTGLSISVYSLVDGVGARLSGNSLSFTAWMFFLDGFILPIVAYQRRSRTVLVNTVKKVWKSAIWVAILSCIGYAIIVWAFSQERIAMVAVLRETSVLFAMLISVFVIREPFTAARIAIITVIVLGIMLLGL